MLYFLRQGCQRGKDAPKIIWGFRIFRDDDALFKAKIALERAYFFVDDGVFNPALEIPKHIGLFGVPLLGKRRLFL